MTGFYARKFKALLEAPLLSEEAVIKDRRVKERYTQIFMDDDTVEWLFRHATKMWRMKYLTYLVEANPTIECWKDTRPEELRMHDRTRLEAGKLPLWTIGT